MNDMVVITGVGLEIPGLADGMSLLQAVGGQLQPGPFNPAAKLGSKGLRYKDRATQLALCAAKAALTDARLPVIAAEQLSPATFGVVVSSNLGNIDTVCRVVETIRVGHVKDTSSLDLPNASSNVVASSLAIRFGCRALNLMLCSGATSGTDALYVAANAIRAGRAKRMLVAGVESVNPATARLMNESAIALEEPYETRYLDVSAAIMLESAAAAAERGAFCYAYVGNYGYSLSAEAENSVLAAVDNDFSRVLLWLTPSCSHTQVAALVKRVLDRWGDQRPDYLDFEPSLGETYGALGVLQAVAACQWLRERGGAVLATTGTVWGDSCASICLYGAHEHAVG
ncbi:MAG: beta-ketoacyl synthase N-terminal-like domain-containing protein [Acidiferrobacterales bacterium]